MVPKELVIGYSLINKKIPRKSRKISSNSTITQKTGLQTTKTHPNK